MANNSKQDPNFVSEEDAAAMESAGLWAPLEQPPVSPTAKVPPPQTNIDNYGGVPLPANLGLQTDLAKTIYPPSTAPIRLMPVAQTPQLGSAIQGTAKRIVTEAIAAIPPVVFPSTGQVNKQTGNYTAQANDTEKLISFDISSNSTLTLPAASPGQSWFILVENNGTAMLTIDPNGLDLDYITNSIVLGPNQGVTIYTDGTNYFTERGIGDGLAHGSSPTETDSSSIVMWDDFTSGTLTSGSIGRLNWTLLNVGSSTFKSVLFAAPNAGVLRLSSAGSANDGLLLTPVVQPTSAGYPVGFPITYTTGWDCSFVFRWPHWTPGGVAAFTKSRLYLGFAVHSNNNAVLRPAKFVGLRYDTDPGATFTLSAASNASAAGVTTYTGTITGGTGNVFQGFQFTVSGFSNAGNNGTFTCCGSSSTSLALLNPNGISESHAGSAVSLALSDTTYRFECVQNGQDGNNVQGSTYDTGLSPDNNWHRFRMRSVVQGQILFSIDGGTEQMLSISTDTYPVYGNLTANGLTEVFGNYNFVGDINVLPTSQVYYSNPCWGTLATLAGCTGSGAVYNGTWPIGDDSTFLSNSNMFLTSTVNSSFGQDITGITLKWYNAFYPVIQFGTDSQGGTRTLDADWFSFVYNPGLAADFNQSPDPTKARFFNGQI